MNSSSNDVVYWRTYEGRDLFSNTLVVMEGWTHRREKRHDHQPIGIFDSYVSALAAHMGLWEEYCEFHRRS